MASDTTPVTDLANKEVFTADGARVGRVTDVIVDLEGETPVVLALANVAERTVGGLPAAAAGVRVPFELVRGVGDVVVLRSAAHEAPLPLPGGRDGDSSAGDPSAGDASATGEDADADPGDPIV